MNHANVIDDGKLKRTYIVAVLVSTLVGTFTSSMGLWDRVKERRQQNQRDTTQDDEIKKLKEMIEGKVDTSKDTSKTGDDKDKGGQDKGKSQDKDKDNEKDEVSSSFKKAGTLINREFEEGYERLGKKFAVGDIITENKLQAQVIAMQQTVIDVLQDAVYHGRRLDRADMAKLIAASDAAREGSLGALRQQKQRLLATAEEARPPPRSPSRPKRASTVVQSDPLYCRYSLDLQYIPNKRLGASSFAPGGTRKCPACGVKLAVDADDRWAVGKRASRWVPRGGYEEKVSEHVEFLVGQRFVVKCHTPDGRYACVICSRYSDKDIICASPDGLVKHLGQSHTMAELEREPDFLVRPMEKERRPSKGP